MGAGDPSGGSHFALESDPAESKTLQAEHPEEVVRLTKLLEQIVANGRSTPGAITRTEVADINADGSP